jgi:hypothetical protein
MKVPSRRRRPKCYLVSSVYITVERDRFARSSAAGARFRVKVRLQPGGPPLLMSAHLCSSVASARREAEAIFGKLAWTELEGETRASAILEVA